VTSISRRDFLRTGALAVGAAALTGSVPDSDWQRRANRTIERAFAADPAGVGSLADIDHVVLLMQENRSFDHYFGAMSGVRGFADPSGVFRQRGWSARTGRSRDGSLVPFHLDTRRRDLNDAEITNDPAHDWQIQHAVWNHGAMDRWILAHSVVDGAATPMVMGYYTRADIPVHYALADAFTVCDHYFSSVLGPTSPNRLHWMTATNDPDGLAGGPIVGSLRHHPRGSLSWRTFPENLYDAGVSWKIYSPMHPGNDINGVVEYFRQYQDPTSPLHRHGVAPVYPTDFLRDIAEGTLPSISWIVPPKASSEHPAHPPAAGAEGILAVLAALTSRPALWERTALIVSYDENGGFFDHVAPPTPRAGEAGEFLQVAGTSAPLGLGFRVPCLILSPYTRGGMVSSQVFDHTSQLQLLANRFGVPIPNLTAWRAGAAGDMASLFRGHRRAVPGVPRIPDVGPAARAAVAGDNALIAAASAEHRPAYPLPRPAALAQDALPRRRPIG
jgi:phospholipase C